MPRTSKVIYGEDYILSIDKRAKLSIHHDEHSHKWVCILAYGSYEPFRSTLKTKEWVGFVGDLDVDLIRHWHDEGDIGFGDVVLVYDNTETHVYYDCKDTEEIYGYRCSDFNCIDFHSEDVTNLIYAQIEKLGQRK